MGPGGGLFLEDETKEEDEKAAIGLKKCHF
jgi:hypothetical protein